MRLSSRRTRWRVGEQEGLVEVEEFYRAPAGVQAVRVEAFDTQWQRGPNPEDRGTRRRRGALRGYSLSVDVSQMTLKTVSLSSITRHYYV